MKILVINGVNLNLLGKRETEHYGVSSLNEIKARTESELPSHVNVDWFESNDEASIVEKLQTLDAQGYDGVVINPGAYAHTSIAILDALKIVKIPVIEVHYSHIFKRESFRHNLLTAQACRAVISGLGEDVYWLGIISLLRVNSAGSKKA